MGDAALIKKLGIKPGQRAAVINPTDLNRDVFWEALQHRCPSRHPGLG